MYIHVFLLFRQPNYYSEVESDPDPEAVYELLARIGQSLLRARDNTSVYKNWIFQNSINISLWKNNKYAFVRCIYKSCTRSIQTKCTNGELALYNIMKIYILLSTYVVFKMFLRQCHTNFPLLYRYLLFIAFNLLLCLLSLLRWCECCSATLFLGL